MAGPTKLLKVDYLTPKSRLKDSVFNRIGLSFERSSSNRLIDS